MDRRRMKHAKSYILTAQVVAIVLGSFVLGQQSNGQSPSPLSPQAESGPSDFSMQAFRPNERTQVQVGLPNAYPATMDRLIVQPKVLVGTAVEMANPMDPNWLASHRPSAELTGGEPFSISQEILPAPQALQVAQPAYGRPSVIVESAPPFFESMLDSVPVVPVHRRSGRGRVGDHRLVPFRNGHSGDRG